ncbi:hypothetical protein AQEC111735_12030 [Aquirufa ecclesiirivi]
MWVAAPELICTVPLVTAVPLCGVKVKVPVPTVPVKINWLVKFATPAVKSPALLNLFVPDNPVIAPVKLVVTVTLFALASKLATVLP